jgi:hydroxymethylglutaryl-CoA reductase (NADPH)
MSFFKNDTTSTNDRQQIEARQKELLEAWKKVDAPHLFAVDADLAKANARNCENMLGAVSLPLGLAGPVDFELESARNKCFVPLATSEGALVASVSRGLKAITQAGGAQLFVKNAGMTRAPSFAFTDGKQAYAFADFLEQKESQSTIRQITESSSKHLKYLGLHSFVRGRQVFVRFSFDTDLAMGMNMVTIALQQLWDEWLRTYSGIEMLSLSSNVCIDKKASHINQLLGRGYSAQAEVVLSEQILREILKTDVKKLLATHQSKNQLGSTLSGSSDHNMQFANVVAAFYLATGQDGAHVVEASQGNTIIEETKLADGSLGLYVAVHLPNLPLGSVGGGTALPSQKEVRSLIFQKETEPSPTQLAAVLATGVLAAEISGLAALSSHALAGAHQKLARKQN